MGRVEEEHQWKQPEKKCINEWRELAGGRTVLEMRWMCAILKNAPVAQENARQELAQAQTPPPTPARQQEIDAAQAALTAAQAAPLSAQQQQRITDAQDNLRDATQDLATELADIASRQQPAIAVAQQNLEQEQRVLAQNPTDAIQRDIVENMRQRLEQAQAGSPQQQQRITDARDILRDATHDLAIE